MSRVREEDTAFAFVRLLERKAPEYFDLITAKTTAEFDRAVDALLDRALTSIEANRRNFEDLDERALVGILALTLSMPGFTVTQETHSNGHVDITIWADHCAPIQKRLGEAKIWDGPEYHMKGVKQLLDRYTTGREGRGLVIEFIKIGDISGLLRRLREAMDETLPCGQTTETSDHSLKWSFLTSHAHSCGEMLEVCHVGCNLYSDPR